MSVDSAKALETQVIDEHYPLKRRRDAPPIGEELDALAAFREAAQALKTAEIAFRAAQQTYADAVKRLSEEAVK